MLIEKNRVANGATGHNGGQAVAAFELTMQELCERFGEDLACAGQRVVQAILGETLAQSIFDP
jgi:glycine/D-amino acid oxidase-like deaminating enzyme